MKVHELTWSTLGPHLEAYESLGPESRVSLRAMSGAQSVAADEFGDDLPRLLKAGLLRALKKAPQVVLTTEARPCLIGLRAAERCRVLDQPSAEAISDYIRESHDARLRDEILLDDSPSYADLGRVLSQRTSSIDWLEALLDASACVKLKRAHARGDSGATHIYTPVIRGLAERLVDALVAAGRPLRVLDLAQVLETNRAHEVDRVFEAALRYLIVFPGLDPDTGALVIGLHPWVRGRLQSRSLGPPEVSDLEVPTIPNVSLADLHQLLVAVGGGHIRIRADGDLFKKDAEDLAASFAPATTDTEQDPAPPALDRVASTVHLGRDLRLTQVGPGTGGRKRLVATEAGRAWVALPPEARLRFALERLGPQAEYVPGDDHDPRKDDWHASDAGPGWDSVFSGLYGILPYGASHVPLRDACVEALRQLPLEGAVSLSAFLLHAARTQNPFLGQGPHAAHVDLERRHGSLASTENREGAWWCVLRDAMAGHLAHWGGLRMGECPKPGDLEPKTLVALNPRGAWLLGMIDEFPAPEEAAAHIVIQPTFEVVFFEPDPQSDAELAPFCDRVGERVGVVFKITKESVSRAAAAGLPVDVIHETIDRLSRTPVPGNVRKEIETWHGRQRVLVLRQPWVLDCGDKETADRVFAAAASKLERLSGTLLALRGQTKPDTIARLLGSHGLTLDTSHVPQPKKRAARRRRRRRHYW